MYLFGASGHGKVVAEICESCNLEIEGFIDNDITKIEICGYSVLHDLPEENSEICITIGDNKIRKRITEENKMYTYLKLIHRSSNISSRCEIGKGTVIMGGVSINVDTHIGNHCIINTNASIDHDCIIKDFVHISPNAALAGNVRIGEGTHVGIGACVIQGITIGNWVTIGAGAVIIRDIPDGCIVVGNPGRIIKNK